MKIDTSGIAPANLAAHLGELYGQRIVSIAFIPKGEDAYALAYTDGKDAFIAGVLAATLSE